MRLGEKNLNERISYLTERQYSGKIQGNINLEKKEFWSHLLDEKTYQNLLKNINFCHYLQDDSFEIKEFHLENEIKEFNDFLVYMKSEPNDTGFISDKNGKILFGEFYQFFIGFTKK